MIVTPETMRASYIFLKKISFKGLNLPKPAEMTFEARKLKKYHGYYKYPEHIITINTDTRSISQMLQIMAHEMIHVALEQNAASDHDRHDANFEELARVIEGEMGWSKGSV